MYTPHISVVRLRLRREPHSRPTIVKVFAAAPLSTFTSGLGGLSNKRGKIKIFFTYIYSRGMVNFNFFFIRKKNKKEIFFYNYSTFSMGVLKMILRRINKMKIIKKEDFPQVLQDFLDSKSISQAELARILNVPKQTINNWIKGRSMPSYDRAIRLMEMMDE